MIPGLGRYPGEGKGYPIQYFGPENSMDPKSRTQLSDFTFTFHFHALERKWQLIPVSLPGKFHGKSILTSYSPWGRKVSDTIDMLMVEAILAHL